MRCFIVSGEMQQGWGNCIQAIHSVRDPISAETPFLRGILTARKLAATLRSGAFVPVCA